jgi:hypothetical protein
VRWRAILIGIVFAALIFLAFAVWASVDEYERGNADASIALIASSVLHNPFYWCLAVVGFVLAYFVANR